jgi:DNA gyrase inhibitor GyrI
VPVMQDPGDPMASDPPVFDDDLEGAWRTRFVMPAGRSADDLPEPPEGVELLEIPARKVAVVSFSGRATNALLAEQEDRLRGWLAKRGVKAAGEPEYAFYNSPMIPGPLRRNEVWLALS